MNRRRFFIFCAALAATLILLWPKKPAPPGTQKTPETLYLRVLNGGEVETLPLEDYILGVTAAEMPADFEPEALRAQAVAARTYALYCAGTGRHEGADVCTDYHCCQAWKSDDAMHRDWGEGYSERLARLRAAVEDTAGQYLRFAGRAAFTAFHSSSAGFTEACGAIWSELPYLVSVSSPENADSVPDYVSRVTVSAEKLRDTLLSACPEAELSGPPEDWLGETRRDDSGRVSEVLIGGAAFSGVKLRTLFSLRSTAFDLDYADDAFCFTVTGFGHGVGMSQYGANVMAAQGADYAAILAHYYPGTELAHL